MEKLSIYRISDKYIRFLHTCDNRVQFNKDSRRPYVGVVLFVGEYRYFVPMESPKPNHAKIKSGVHIFKLDGGRLGILGFNNMVPVPDCALIEFNIDDEPDKRYRALLYNQLAEIDRNRAALFQRSAKTYFEVVNKTNEFLCRISCDFKELERASKRYDPNHKTQKAKPEG